MEVVDVEEIAIAPPDFVEDLGPLLCRNAVDDQVGGGDGLFFALARWRRVSRRLKAGPCFHEHLQAVGRQRVAVDPVGQGLLLAIADGVNSQLGLRLRVATVVERTSADLRSKPDVLDAVA